MATTKELVAAERGYPGTLMGFTPNDAAYWREPGLPWAPQLPLLRTSMGDQLYEVADYAEFVFITEDMAPRFPAGTLVTIEPVLTREALCVGCVYVHLHPTEADELQVGRLAQVGATSLELTQDNNPARLTWPLHEDQHSQLFNLYQVTYYSESPAQREELPADAEGSADLYLLELHANHMGPRYPVGARYLTWQVPPERWAQAKGVHALHLRDGRQLLARLVGVNLSQLVLSFDGTGEMGTVALADVAQLWKLGVADYMPEETEAEHLLAVQRPAY